MIRTMTVKGTTACPVSTISELQPTALTSFDNAPVEIHQMGVISFGSLCVAYPMRIMTGITGSLLLHHMTVMNFPLNIISYISVILCTSMTFIAKFIS